MFRFIQKNPFRSERVFCICAGGRSVILAKQRPCFCHGEEAPSYDEETPQPCFAKTGAVQARFKRSTPNGALINSLKSTIFKRKTMSILLWLVLFVLFILVFDTFFIVKQQTAVVIERLGKFHSVRFAGFNFKLPVVDRPSRPVNLRIQQLDVNVETKTKDDVFVHLKVSTQYQIPKDRVKDAYYKLQDPAAQITSYIFDVVRAEVPKMRLDDVFVRKDDIAIAIKNELNDAMIEYGYDIIKTLVTDIDPDARVKEAMNRINAAEREKVAAQYEADATRIRIVERAKAEAESKKLQGKGIADQRREIAQGLEDSMVVLNRAGINPQEASALIVITQHYDTLQAIGQDNKSNLILLPNNPTAASGMMSDMVASLIAANKMNDQLNENKKEDDQKDRKQ